MARLARFFFVLAILGATYVDVVEGGKAKAAAASAAKPAPPAAPATTRPAVTTAVATETSTIVSFSSPEQALRWGMLCALNTGWINACCLSGFLLKSISKKQAVAAVTGSWTNSAVGAATALRFASDKAKTKAGMTQFHEQSMILFSYIVGSATYGLLNPNPEPFRIVRWSASMSFFLSSVCLFVAGAADSGMLPWAKDWNPLFTLCLGAVASGIQNSFTSSHSGNLLRTTHYSGMSSDIGTFWGQALRGNHKNLFKLRAFLQLGASFWLGGFIAARFGASGDTYLAAGAVLPFVLGVLILLAPSGDDKTA